MFLMELLFANCMNEIPTAAARERERVIKGLHLLVKTKKYLCNSIITYLQYRIKHSLWPQILVAELMRKRLQISLKETWKKWLQKKCKTARKLSIQGFKWNIIPKMEKKIMKPQDICTTLLLPICVRPSRPTFSLQLPNRLVRLVPIYRIFLSLM